MHHLAGSMDAGVSSSRGKGLDRTVGIQLFDGRFQLSLNTVAIALTLPPAKGRTLVLQTEGDPTGDRGLRECRRGFGAQTSELTQGEGIKPVR